MSMRSNSENPNNEDQLSLIQPTIGWEGEVIPIRFFLKKGNEIYFIPNDTVYSVFGNTKNGVQCEQDVNVDAAFSKHLITLAEDNNLLLNKYTFPSYIFEFVTSPTDNLETLRKQFADILFIQTDLIKYIQNNQHLPLINVKEWIIQYNTHNPDNPLPFSDQAAEMFIDTEYSLQQLNENEYKSTEEIQAQMPHNVQFNFVAGFGNNMGSLLTEIYDANNRAFEKEKELNILQQKIADGIKAGIEAGMSESAARNQFITEERKSENIKNFLEREKLKRNILLEAERNAKHACEFLRENLPSAKDKPRKLAKLEGFFFFLSMRLLTETSYIELASVSSSKKNKYLFFLKAQLSELIQGLSAQDRQLLAELKSLSDEKKNILFKNIAGSAEILTINYHINGKKFTVKNVLESAFGWTNDKTCDLFPGAPVKTFAAAHEPTTPGLRGQKEHSMQFRRYILEYRASPYKKLIEAEQIMQNMLAFSAELCKTTTLRKKAQTQLQEAKHAEAVDVVENIAEKAINLIRMYQLDNTINLKTSLKTILFNENQDTLLKQINYLFLKIKNGTEFSNEKAFLEKVISELFSEKIFSMFTFPLKDRDNQYIDYLLERYALSKQPIVKEYLTFIRYSNHFNLKDLHLMTKYTDAWFLEYFIRPDSDINKTHAGRTALRNACYYNLTNLMDKLLKLGATATSNELILVINNDALTTELANQLIDAGVDLGRTLFYFATRKTDNEVKAIVEVIGKERLDNIILKYPNDTKIKNYLQKIQGLFAEEKKHDAVVLPEQSTALHHSVLFQPPETKKLLLQYDIFLMNIRDALASYTKSNSSKSTRKDNIIKMLPKPNDTRIMTPAEIYDLLARINTELNRKGILGGKNKVLRALLNPHLRNMLHALPKELDTNNLLKDFGSNAPTLTRK